MDQTIDVESRVDLLKLDIEKCLVSDIIVSSASASWLEMMYVEVILRNRDRISSLWPSLEFHYSSSLNSCSVFSYKSERCAAIDIACNHLFSTEFLISEEKQKKCRI